MIASMSERPSWSASEAARRCRVGRATIQRALTAGRIPGAQRTYDGWSIPLDGLLAAGFTPDRPIPPNHAREHVRAPDQAPPAHDAELSALRAELDLERTRRHAAEALATERAERVADLRLAMRQLTGPEPSPAPPPDRPAPPPSRRLIDRAAARLRRR